MLCSSSGFSLIELMLSVALGLILIAGTFTVYASNARSSALNQAMASMQESLRYGMSVMENDVRMSGYQGCMNPNSSLVNIVASSSPSANLSKTAVSGAIVQSDATWTPTPELGSGSSLFTPPASITPRVGTHTLAVQYALTPGSKLTEAQQESGSIDASGPLSLEQEIDVATGDLALVATCDAGEIFGVSAVASVSGGGMTISHSTAHNAQASFQQVYGIDSQIDQTLVMPYLTHVYFVADSGENKPDGTPVYALYQQTFPFNEGTNPPTILIDGVENMQIQFGIGGTNSQLQYANADDSAYDPANIRSVRIGLLMSSYDTLLRSSDSKNYLLAGTSIGVSATPAASDSYADDKRFRLAANSTTTVRNRRPLQ